MLCFQKLNFVLDCECCCCEHPMKLQKKKNSACWLVVHNNNIRNLAQNSASDNVGHEIVCIFSLILLLIVPIFSAQQIWCNQRLLHLWNCTAISPWSAKDKVRVTYLIRPPWCLSLAVYISERASQRSFRNDGRGREREKEEIREEGSKRARTNTCSHHA